MQHITSAGNFLNSVCRHVSLPPNPMFSTRSHFMIKPSWLNL